MQGHGMVQVLSLADPCHKAEPIFTSNVNEMNAGLMLAANNGAVLRGGPYLPNEMNVHIGVGGRPTPSLTSPLDLLTLGLTSSEDSPGYLAPATTTGMVRQIEWGMRCRKSHKGVAVSS